jgi:magnesium chelatase subunit H
MRALDGRFIAPVPGGDLIRSPADPAHGRNIHAFDPFRMPTAFALRDGAAQAQRLLDTHPTLPRTWRWCCGGRTTSNPTAARSRRRWR